MSEDEREYGKSWKPCTVKERGCMAEGAAAEFERDHDWLFYKESYDAASKVDRRRCQRCGLEQIMVDVGGNGQWLPVYQGMMKSGSAAVDMISVSVHDGIIEMKGIDAKELILDLVNNSKERGESVKIKHTQTGNVSITKFTFKEAAK